MKGQVLATLEAREQSADVSGAAAGVQSAQASLTKAAADFERKKQLMAQGFTTRTIFDGAVQALRAAQAALDGAKANLKTALDKRTDTALRADGAGIIISRNAEAGQVVEAAQPVFRLARDGAYDAIFNVYEALLAKPPPADNTIRISLAADPSVRTTGRVREVAPTIDPSTGTVRVKVGVAQLPQQMGLGAAVVGVADLLPRDVIVLPWTALSFQDGRPAVWVVDPKSKSVAPKPVVVDTYRTHEVWLRSGLAPGDIVVTAGMQMLRMGEVVTPMRAAQSADPK